MARSMKNGSATGGAARKYLSQSDVPYYSLQQALKIAQALADQFGRRPARPIQVAQALNVQPSAGPFRMLCGSSIAYGLTEGGYNAAQITLTPLGRRVVAPTAEGDDAKAMREAFLRPRVLKDFLSRYDRAKLPRDDIAQNVLAELEVPGEATSRALNLIKEGARMLGLLREIKGALYVDLQETPISDGSPANTNDSESELPDDAVGTDELDSQFPGAQEPPAPSTLGCSTTRVFISHGRNRGIVDQVKTMLNVAEVEYEVAVEEQVTAIPVPDKVLGAMRRCNAAIICVTADESISQSAASDAPTAPINQNVLIEIGAAFVLYDRRVILLWDKRLPVPSNLQGLYRCEFQGSELSWAVGMKLMEAIKRFPVEATGGS